MDLTDAFQRFLEPSARPMAATALNESVSTFISDLGGFSTLLELLSMQTEDSADDLMLADTMRRTAARVFSSTVGLDNLRSTDTVSALLPLLRNSPSAVLRLLLDGLTHALTFQQQQPSAMADSDTAATAAVAADAVPRWRLPAEVYATLLDRCRWCDTEDFHAICALIAHDSALNEVRRKPKTKDICYDILGSHNVTSMFVHAQHDSFCNCRFTL